MPDNDIEQEIQDKGLTAPRITPQRINESIRSEHYFSASDASGSGESAITLYTAATDMSISHDSLRLLTICVLVLRNGFTVTGESACASPENFDAEIGRKIARENAVNKIWMLEGYLLKQKLSEQ